MEQQKTPNDMTNPVRCGQCKHSKEYPFADGMMHCYHPEANRGEMYLQIVHEAWFCPFGEKKEQP